jgi:hypothetical protein
MCRAFLFFAVLLAQSCTYSDPNAIEYGTVDFASALDTFFYIEGTEPNGGCLDTPQSESDPDRSVSEKILGTYKSAGSLSAVNPVIAYAIENPDIESMSDYSFMPAYPLTISSTVVESVGTCSAPSYDISIAGPRAWIITFPISDTEACVAALSELENNTVDSVCSERSRRMAKSEWDAKVAGE